MSINSCRQENNKKVMRTTVIRRVSIKWGGATDGRYAEVHSKQKTGCVEKVQELLQMVHTMYDRSLFRRRAILSVFLIGAVDAKKGLNHSRQW